MDTLMAFGIASVLLLLGMAIRAKISAVRKMLVPATVIAGAIGFVCMNTFLPVLTDKISFSGYTDLVNDLFTLSFISIGLTGTVKKQTPQVDTNGKKKKRGPLYRGSMGMGLTWCMLYGLQAATGVAVLFFIGSFFGMDPVYGLLISYGFCQGPGQAATNGLIYENTYGIPDASQVAIAYAVIGFAAAYIVGVPMVQWGMKKGLLRSKEEINHSIARGFFDKEEQRQSMGKVTTHSGNVETLAYHVALMGISYLFAMVFSRLVYFIPGVGPGFSGMMFFHGLLGAYLVKAIVKKLGLDYLQNATLQSKITGFCTDFLVIMSFMSVGLGSVGIWMIPIIIVAVAVTMVTLAVCLFFGQRFGDENDFERFLGLFGTACGTTPSGLSLVRMVDPSLRTSTGAELGMMSAPETFSMFPSITMLLAASGVIPLGIEFVLLIAMAPIYALVMKLIGCMNSRTWSFNLDWNRKHGLNSNVFTDDTRLRGSLHLSQETMETETVSQLA